MSGANYIKFSGHQFITQRLVLSTLTGKPIKIDKIRSEEDNPGLQGTIIERKISLSILKSIKIMYISVIGKMFNIIR